MQWLCLREGSNFGSLYRSQIFAEKDSAHGSEAEHIISGHEYFLSQSNYEQTNNGAKYEYVRDVLCSVTDVEDVLLLIRSAIFEP